MAIATQQNAESFFDIVAGVPLNNNYPLYDEDEVVVVYGYDILVAVLNVDYTVELNEPNFNTFTITPLPALITKINDLIADDPDEINYVTVRRSLPLTTSVQPNTIGNTTFLSREIERIWMAIIEGAENFQRTLGLPPSRVGDPDVRYYMDVPEAGKVPIWDDTGKRLTNGPTATEITDAQGNAEDAIEARIAAEAARDLSEGYRDDTLLLYNNTVANNDATAAQIQAMVNGLDIADQVLLTFANSPYTVTQADNGKMLMFDTSGGAPVVNLPVIAPLVKPFVVGIGKRTTDTNAITYNRSGSDQIEGANSDTITTQNEKVILRPDVDYTPDQWIKFKYGATAGSATPFSRTAPADFTPGVSNTVSTPPGVLLFLAVDSLTQDPTTFSRDANTGLVTFSETILVGTERIHGAVVNIVPIAQTGSNTVGWGELMSSLIGSVSDIANNIANKIPSVQAIFSYLQFWKPEVLLSTIVAANQATVDFVSIIDNTYDEYVIKLEEVVLATDNISLYVRTSSNNGVSFDSGASDYSVTSMYTHVSASTVAANNFTALDRGFMNADALGNVTQEGFQAVMRLIKPLGNVLRKKIEFRSQFDRASDGVCQVLYGSIIRLSQNQINAIRFYASSGNILSGTFKIYGVRK